MIDEPLGGGPAGAEDPAAHLPTPTLDRAECDEVIGHVEEFLSSPMTAADARDLRLNVAEAVPGLADLEVEEIIRVIMKRSCCERAPEALRLRVHTQMAVWRSEI
jgi:anti-sigma factor (TIGR02949 family)